MYMESSGPSSSSSSSSFDRDRHVRFLEMMLDALPSEYQEQEINRLTLAYFAISGLQILDALDQVHAQFNLSLFALFFNLSFFLGFWISDVVGHFVRWIESESRIGYYPFKHVPETNPICILVWMETLFVRFCAIRVLDG